MHYRVNAGFVRGNHWIQDAEQGGGRIVGEVCHFVDLLSFITDSIPVRVAASPLSNNSRYCDDNVIISIGFANGSQGNIVYAANGDTLISKERLEIFGAGSAALLDDFRSLVLARNGQSRKFRSLLQQDKGHRGEWQAFSRALLTGGPAPISLEQLVSTSLATFQIVNSLRCNEPLQVDTDAFIANALAQQLASGRTSRGEPREVMKKQEVNDVASAGV